MAVRSSRAPYHFRCIRKFCRLHYSLNSLRLFIAVTGSSRRPVYHPRFTCFINHTE